MPPATISGGLNSPNRLGGMCLALFNLQLCSTNLGRLGLLLAKYGIFSSKMTIFGISRQLSDIICQLGQLSARTTVSSDICQLGHLSARTTVRPDNCKVSNCQNPMDNCQIKLSELWKNCQSYGKTVSSDSCPLKTVRPDSCPSTGKALTV